MSEGIVWHSPHAHHWSPILLSGDVNPGNVLLTLIISSNMHQPFILKHHQTHLFICDEHLYRMNLHITYSFTFGLAF